MFGQHRIGSEHCCHSRAAPCSGHVSLVELKPSSPIKLYIRVMTLFHQCAGPLIRRSDDLKFRSQFQAGYSDPYSKRASKRCGVGEAHAYRSGLLSSNSLISHVRDHYCTLVALLGPPWAAQPLIMTRMTAGVAPPLPFPPAAASCSFQT